jgi:transposase
VSEPDRVHPVNPADLVQLVETLQQRVADLERINAELRAENARLRRRQQRQAAPFSKDAPLAAPKQPGRKPGQGRFVHRSAPPQDAYSTPPIPVPVTASGCPHCGGTLVAAESEVASITDLPVQPPVVVRQYQVAVCRCQTCGRRVRGQHPDLAADQYGATAHRLGSRLLATAHSLHYQHGVPVRRVPAILAELTGVHLTQGALTQDAPRQATGPVGVAYQTLRAGMAQAERVHTDDTGWRVGGTPAQLMVFTTPTATVYQIRRQHRNQEVREILPSDYAGVLCSDRGKSYDAHELAAVKQQKCLCHLLRSVHELLETKWGRGRSFGLQVQQTLREALALWQAVQAGTATDYPTQVARLQARMTEVLRERAMPDPTNQRLLDDLRWRHTRGDLLRFLEDPRIEPTNNRAERALRPAVIARKVSQCSKTQAGADAHAAFTSVLRTAVQQGDSGAERLAHLRRSPPALDR